MVYGSEWIAFDLPQTIYMKILEARKLGLGGLMVGAAFASFHCHCIVRTAAFSPSLPSHPNSCRLHATATGCACTSSAGGAKRLLPCCHSSRLVDGWTD